jgi:transcriptional regulator with XRE-family HTH domain
VASFSVRLRQLRQQHGLSLQQLAALTGIHTTQLGRFERGLQPRIDAIVRIAKAFNTDVHELANPVLDQAVANSPTVGVAN